MTKLDDQLDALAASIPAPRRTDAAFARSVADGVRAKKSRTVFMFPLAAATTAALAVFAVVHPAQWSTTTSHDAGTGVVATTVTPHEAPDHVATSAASTTSTTATAATAAGADAMVAMLDDEDSPFALPSLEGSSDEELAFLDRALDERLQTRDH